MPAANANGRVIDPPVPAPARGEPCRRLPAAMTAAVVVVAVVVIAIALPAAVVTAVVVAAAVVATIVAAVVAVVIVAVVVIATVAAVGGGQVADRTAGHGTADGRGGVAVGEQVAGHATDHGANQGALVLPRHRAGIADHGDTGHQCQSHRQTTEAECGSTEHVRSPVRCMPRWAGRARGAPAAVMSTLAFQHCRNIAWPTVQLAHSSSGRRHEARLKAGLAAQLADRERAVHPGPVRGLCCAGCVSDLAVAQVIEQFGVALQAQLEHGVTLLAADGADTFVQLQRDLLHGHAGAEQPQYLHLAGRQRLAVALAHAPAARRLDPLAPAAADVGLAAAQHAAVEHHAQDRQVVGDAEHQHRQLGMTAADHADHGEAIGLGAAGHGVVGDQQVAGLVAQQGHQRLRAVGFADHAAHPARFDDGAGADTDHRVVVCDDDAQAHALLGCSRAGPAAGRTGAASGPGTGRSRAAAAQLPAA
ncbi:hypothetical protein G6F31_013257 [Rhizopus arrhizus]|nr:hypothetical protein G6F31_013257 [Rhizopus arrhizus]